jgi:hypothetical protein
MKDGKQVGLAAIFISILAGVGLQGCSPSSVVKDNPKSHTVSSSRLTDTGRSTYSQRGFSEYLSHIAQGVNIFTEKPIPVSQNPLLRQVILSTSRGKVLTSCQFPALRIELDGNKNTSDWLVTTKGKGARCAADSRYFWIIQQDGSSPAKILLSSRGRSVGVSRPKNARWAELKIEGSAMIPIKSGDKLADGSWVQVPSRDKGRVQIACRSKFRLQGSRYQPYAESVEANVVSLPFPGKTWQPVTNPRYRCSF